MKLQEKKFYPWLVVVLLMVVSLLNYLDRQMLSTMRPYMLHDFPELVRQEDIKEGNVQLPGGFDAAVVEGTLAFRDSIAAVNGEIKASNKANGTNEAQIDVKEVIPDEYKAANDAINALKGAENFGRLMAIFLWIYAFLSPFSGMIADRLNRKWLIVGSLFVWSSITIGMGYVTSFKVLYVLRGLMGISEAFYIPAALSLAADYHQGTTRSKALAILTAGVYLGTVFGGFGANVADATSWQTTFKLFGVVGVVYSLVLITLIYEKKTYVASTEKQSFGQEMKAFASGFKVLFTSPAFWVLIYFFAALSLPGWVTKNWLPTLVSESLGIPMKQAGPIAAISLACSSLVGVFIGGWMADKWSSKVLKGRVFTSAVGLIMTIPALIMLNFGATIAPNSLLFVMVFSAILFGVGFGMYDANNMPIVCQFFPSRYRATCFGLMNFAGIAAGAVITTQLGKAMDAGNQDMVFYIMIAAVVVAVFLQLAVLKPTTLDKTEK